LTVYSNSPRVDRVLFGFSGVLNVRSFLNLINIPAGTEIKKQSVRPVNRDSIPGKGIAFFFTIVSRPTLGYTQPPHQGYWVYSLGVKPPKSAANHSCPWNAEIKNVWNYTSRPPYVFMA
jgi:hypothetical protein